MLGHHRLLIIGVLASLIGVGCRSTSGGYDADDSPIVTTGPESQGGTAFCWAYAIVAHLEQRFFELTRGAESGGFRLNFSEEFLGLMHLLEQITMTTDPSEFQGEGMRLGQGLDLVERYGIVPERIGEKPFFRPKFDVAIGPRAKDEVIQVLDSLRAQWPISPQEAVKIIARIAELNADQERFLLAAYTRDHANSTFSYAGGNYTPTTFAKNRLKYKRAEYYVLQIPDSGRGEDPNAKVSAEYNRSLQVIRKAMLYGYSVPISFNFHSEGRETNGTLNCPDPGCPFATMNNSDSPHANHAVLLVDFRRADSTFAPASPANLSRSMEQLPAEWLIKNSWGFNRNTSRQPELLQRYPLPAFTVMTQDFFEASHRLRPGRYEAIVPKQVCLRHTEATDEPYCESLVLDEDLAGTPKARGVNTQLATERLQSYLGTEAQRRLGIQYLPNIGRSENSDAALTLREVGQQSLSEFLPQFSLKAATTISGVLEDRFYLCVGTKVGPQVKYVAAYMLNEDPAEKPYPAFVLDEQNKWQHCATISNDPRKFRIILQSIDRQWRVRSETGATVEIKVSKP